MEGDPQADIRAAFRRRRERLGLRQADMAKLLGIHRIAYTRMEGSPRAQSKILTPEIRAQLDKVLSKLEAEMQKQVERDLAHAVIKALREQSN